MLDLPRHAHLNGHYGTVFIIPSRTRAQILPLVLPLRDPIDTMCEVLVEAAPEVDLSNQVYWYYKGVYEVVGIEVVGEKPRAMLPERLQAMLVGG